MLCSIGAKKIRAGAQRDPAGGACPHHLHGLASEMVAVNEEMYHRRGLYFRNIEPKPLMDTYKFGTNIVIHLLTRWEDKLRNVPRTGL